MNSTCLNDNVAFLSPLSNAMVSRWWVGEGAQLHKIKALANGNSFKKITDLARATLTDVNLHDVAHSSIHETSCLGTKGKFEGNLLRDFGRYANKITDGNWISPYCATLGFKSHATDHVVSRRHPMYLPHEICGAL